MINIFIIFAIGAAISAAAILITAAMARFRRVTKAMRRSALMFAVFAALGVVLHLATLRSSAFRNTIPFALLAIDVESPVYGELAIEESLRRARADALTSDEIRHITDSLLDDDPWWLNPQVAIDPARPADEWLITMLASQELTPDQLARWLVLAPPPIFSAPALVEPGAEIPVSVVYGRKWEYARNMPYQIDQIMIDRVLVNGDEVSFGMEHEPDSMPDLGMFADKVRFTLTGLKAPEVANADWRIDVYYRLNIEPGHYANIGPLDRTMDGLTTSSKTSGG